MKKNEDGSGLFKKIADLTEHLPHPSKGFPHVGMRIFKTGLCVFIVLTVYKIFGREQASASLALVAAIVALRDTVKNSLISGINRIIANFFGGLLGIGSIWVYRTFKVDTNSILFFALIGILSMICIAVCVWLNIPDASVLAVVVMIMISVNDKPIDETYSYAIDRLIDTTIGIVISIVINIMIKPPEDLENNETLEIQEAGETEKKEEL